MMGTALQKSNEFSESLIWYLCYQILRKIVAGRTELPVNAIGYRQYIQLWGYIPYIAHLGQITSDGAHVPQI